MSTAALLTNRQNYGTTDNGQLNVDNRDGLKQKALASAETRLQSRERELERAIYEVSKATFDTSYWRRGYQPKLEKLLGGLPENRNPQEIDNTKTWVWSKIGCLIEENQPKDFEEFYKTVEKVEGRESLVESIADEIKWKKKCMIAVSFLLPVIGWIWALLFYFSVYSEDKSYLKKYIFDLSNDRANLAAIKQLPNFQEVLTILKKKDPDYRMIKAEIREILAEPSSAIKTTAVHFQMKWLSSFTNTKKHQDGYNYKVKKFLTMSDPKLRYKKKHQELPAIQSNESAPLFDPLNEQQTNPQTARPQKKEENTGSLYDRLNRSQKNSKDSDSRLATDVKVFRANHPRFAQDI